MSHTMKQRAAADVATPAAGRATVFVDSDDGEVKAKLPDGSVTGGPGGGGAADMSIIATIALNGANGSVNYQAGSGIEEASRLSTGVYEILITTPGGPFGFIPVIAVRSASMRSATCDLAYTDQSNIGTTLTVRVWDAAGAAADCDWLYVAIMAA